MIEQDRIAELVHNEADMAYRRRVFTIFEWLEPEKANCVLDAGCGRGFYLNFIRQVCNTPLVGMELEFDFIQKARLALAPYPDISLVNSTLYALPFPHNYFDRIILSEVLEHVPDDTAALQALYAILQPGGLLAITVPNANYPFWWDPINKTLETFFGTHIQHGVLAGIWANHERLYTREQLRAAVMAAGLEIVEERSFTHYCFPFIHNIVYGFGKTVLEAGLLPATMAKAADRHNTSLDHGSRFNPVNVGLRIFEWFDRRNSMHEPPGRSTVNLCVLARKPH